MNPNDLINELLDAIVNSRDISIMLADVEPIRLTPTFLEIPVRQGPENLVESLIRMLNNDAEQTKHYDYKRIDSFGITGNNGVRHIFASEHVRNIVGHPPQSAS